MLLQAGMSQPLLNQAEKYPLGVVLHFTRADTANVSPGPAGGNVNWNFSSLTPLAGTLQKQALLPSQTAYENDFPTSDWALENNEGTINFFKESADSIWMVGLVQTFAGIKITYTKPVLYFTRNLVYNGSVQGTTRYHYTYSSYNYKCGGTYSLTADAYGTLKLPARTYSNVMRVKFESLNYDTLQGQGGYVQVTKVVSYSWYNAYNGAPLLNIDSLDISSPFYNETRRSVSFAQNPANTVASVNASEPIISISPGRLQVVDINDAFYKLTLYDMAGRELVNNNINIENSRGEAILPETLPPGCYIIRLENENKTVQQKLVIL